MTSLSIALDSSSALTLTEQIRNQILTMIRHGMLNEGDVLPSTRLLAKDLGVSRNTVVSAYRDLVAEGYLEGYRRNGTRVAGSIADRLQRLARPISHAENVPWHPPELARRTGLPSIYSASLFDPERSRLRFDFRIGLPDSELFPFDAWAKCIKDRMSRVAKGVTSYGDPAGNLEFRSAIANYVRLHRGIVCSTEQVIITSGIQQGLDIACRLLLDEGCVVAIENPTYTSASALFSSHGATLLPFESFERLLLPTDRVGPARAIYVTPSHQFPMGHTMDLDTRLELLHWAKKAGAFILEDDYDSDFRYRSAPLSALASIDDNERVIYFGTFSKTMGAGLRMGYMVVPPSLTRSAKALKNLADHGRSWLEQVALAEFISSGMYDSHVRRVRTIYKNRCELVSQALLRAVPDSKLRGSDGGMHLSWILPPRLPIANELQKFLLNEGVGIYTLQDGPAYIHGNFEQADRVVLLGYPCISDSKLQEALGIIGSAIQSVASM